MTRDDGRRARAGRREWLRFGLGRAFDFRLVSNRIALAVPVLAGCVAGVWELASGSSLADAVRSGIAAGGASFLAWATARELDPDHAVTAGFAAVAAPWLVLWAHPALAAGGLWLLAVRAVSGTTGAGPYRLDIAVVGALAVWAAAADRGMTAALGGLAAFAAAAVFEGRGRTRALLGAGVLAAVSVGVAVVGTRALAPVSHGAATLWWIAAVAGTASIAVRVRVTSFTDRRPEPLSRPRVRWAVVAAAGWCALAVIWHGPIGVAVSGPALVALGCAAVRAAASGE